MTHVLSWSSAHETAQAYMKDWTLKTPGGAILGFDQNGIRFSLSGGLANLNTGETFTADSVIRYASVTKHAFCSMVLSHPDMIGLDERLGDHLPELQAPLSDVTVGRALDMSGGLPDVRECLTLLGLSVYSETRAAPILDFLARMTRLNFAAGTEVSYSNTGYRLVEAALERKGLRFRDYIRKAAALHGAVFDAPDVWNDPVEGLQPGYWHDGKTWQLSAAGLHISASGSMTGSARSLAHWLQGLMRDETIVKKLAAPRPLADGRISPYGLGMAETVIGGKSFIGHGGSHPGYKTYFLLDPEQKTGIVVVSNREDTNGAKIAQTAMAALYGLALPTPSSALTPGLYVADHGPYWLKVEGSTVTSLDAEDTVYEAEDGSVSSRSSTSPIRLRMEADKVIGEIGHAPRLYRPVQAETVPDDLSGQWHSEEGAAFEIANGHVIMGIGPTRQAMGLTALGKAHFLFTLHDGPWTKTVCLYRQGPDRIDLVLNRARMMGYHRGSV